MENVYQPPETELYDDSNQPDPQFGGFWIRLGASIIDSIWLMLLTFSLGWLVYGMAYFSSDKFIQGPADILISYVLPFILTMLFWSYWAATPGKRLLGLRIVDAKTGGKVSRGRLVGRYFAYLISLIPLCIGYLWIGWDKKKQGWHDKIAGTLVVQGK